MIPTLLFVAFLVMMLMGVPIGAALGLAGAACIALANSDAQWFGLLAVPQNFYAGLGKYPLLAIPMFVLVGSIFDRSGVALRLVNFAVACVGRSAGMLPLVAVVVAMVLGGISGSGPANAAAVGAVMIAAMARAGYPAPFSASIVGAAAATDILIPPSIAFVVYSVSVPGASVPALFAAGMLPGILAGLALIVPAVWLSRRRGYGALERELPRPPFWPSLGRAAWGLAAPVLILGGMRAGWFTPTEAAVVAVVYGLLVGHVRSIAPSSLRLTSTPSFANATEVSAVIMIVMALAGIFAYSLSNTLGVIDPITLVRDCEFRPRASATAGALALVLIAAARSPWVCSSTGCRSSSSSCRCSGPLMLAFRWDVVWFGVLLTMKSSRLASSRRRWP
jgi:C4-dicarboxylate transporter DctM subunit